MSIKEDNIEEVGVKFVTKIHNEFVQTRTDQIMMGEDLTRRINGVANDVKALDGTVQELKGQVSRLDARVGSLETKFDQLEAKVDAGFDKVDGQISSLQKGQLEMMNILIAIQRKLDVN